MSKITRVGIDTAKSIFHVIGIDTHNKEGLKKVLKRPQVLSFFNQLPPCTVVMEACSGSHYWARAFQGFGHEVMLIPAQHAKAYRQGQKNDFNDARGIIQASLRPDIHAVRIKTVADQDLQALSRLRSQAVANRSSLARSLRGLLTERGIVLKTGLNALRVLIPGLLEDGDNGLTVAFRGLLSGEYGRLLGLDEVVKAYDTLLDQAVKADAGCRRLLKIPGYGPVVALQFRSKMGNGDHLRRGRDAAVLVGLTPRHHGTGGKNRTGSITKHGDSQLRCALAHGARAVVSRAKGKSDPVSHWIQQMEARVGRNKTTIALANKMARVGWSILRYGGDYDPKLMCAAR
jgi:transposase